MGGAVGHVSDTVRLGALSAFGNVPVCPTGLRWWVQRGAWPVLSLQRRTTVWKRGLSTIETFPCSLGSHCAETEAYAKSGKEENGNTWVSEKGAMVSRTMELFCIIAKERRASLWKVCLM